MLVDTHCHLTSPELLRQLKAVEERARAAGVSRAITVATRPSDAATALEQLADAAWVFLCAGIHPHEAARIDDADWAALEALHRGDSLPARWRGRLVAVGETGLDFHYDFAPAELQEQVFRRQLELALRVSRPVVIHARKSEDRVCDILAEYPALRGRVVFHCFSGSTAIAERILTQDHWLSFTGVVTFKNADEVRQAARICPSDRILVETDSPFLTPEPRRNVRPNEPAFVELTARYVARLRGVEFADFARLTSQNAERFFGLPEE